MVIAAGVAAAAVGAAGAIGGSAMSANASKKAAKTQERAARNATEAQLQMYNQTREDLAPYRAAGTAALGQLGGLTAPGGDLNRDFTMADFQADPGYQHRLAEGAKAIERSAAARGNVFSGATMKDLTRFGQNEASNEYGRAFERFHGERTNRFNRLASLAGLGQTATNTTGALAANTGAQIGSNLIGAGNAAAAGQVGAANAISQGIAGATGAINQGVNNYLLMSALRNPQYPTYATRGGVNPYQTSIANPYS